MTAHGGHQALISVTPTASSTLILGCFSRPKANSSRVTCPLRETWQQGDAPLHSGSWLLAPGSWLLASRFSLLASATLSMTSSISRNAREGGEIPPLPRNCNRQAVTAGVGHCESGKTNSNQGQP